MKVAVVTKHFPNSNSRWAGHSTYQTLRILAQRCDLQVFYPVPVYPRLFEPRSSRRPPLDLSWSPSDVQTTYIPHPVFPVVSRSFNGFTIARRVLPYVRRFAPDILLSYFIYPDGYATVNMARSLKVPAVITAVGSDLNRIPDAICKRLTRSALINADFVSTVSQDLCNKARSLGVDPVRSRTKLNGCDTSIFHPMDRRKARESLSLEADSETVVYVGRLDLRKGLLELIKAIAQLHQQRPRLRCHIVGDGPAAPILLAAIAQHNMKDVITLPRSCPTAKVAVWMAAADLVTLPSYAEGCPNVIIEALAAGRPVVATNVGGIPELVDESCGRLVPPRDVPALAQALDEVLSQTWDAEVISAKHMRSWANVADDLYQILDEVLHNGINR